MKNKQSHFVKKKKKIKLKKEIKEGVNNILVVDIFIFIRGCFVLLKQKNVSLN